MIYLDNFATTPIDSSVQDTVVNTMKSVWANPHSATHEMGWMADDVLDKARSNISQYMGVKIDEIIFTSGATESNNMVIKGLPIPAYKRHKILISAIEHPCVYNSAYYMQKHGYVVQEIPLDSNGLIDKNAYHEMLDDTVCLVSILHVDNVFGVIQDIKGLCADAHKVGALFHTDCAQAVGKIPVSFSDLGVDYMSISAHKFYGPKGIGAVFIKQGIPCAELFSGGGQQRGIRSGTVPTPLVAGLSHAITVSDSIDHTRIRDLRDTLERYICKHVQTACILGGNANRVAGASHIYIQGVRPDDFFTEIQGVCVSSVSACASLGKQHPRHLQAMGIPLQDPSLSMRICIARQNTQQQIEQAKQIIVETILR